MFLTNYCLPSGVMWNELPFPRLLAPPATILPVFLTREAEIWAERVPAEKLLPNSQTRL